MPTTRSATKSAVRRPLSSSTSKTPPPSSPPPPPPASTSSSSSPSFPSFLSLFHPSTPWVLTPTGSFNGHFDFVPIHLRTGPWFVLALPYVLLLITAIFVYKPSVSLGSDDIEVNELYSKYHIFDILGGINGIAVLVTLVQSVGYYPFVTYTIWSWTILTTRLISSSILPFLKKGTTAFFNVGHITVLTRFPSLVAATVTFTIWNFILAPVIYALFLDTRERKLGFLKFNFKPHMIQIHILNYPIAVTSCILSSSTSKLFIIHDLWVASFVALMYCALYLGALDRIGVHLYPVFSPRSKFCVIAWSFIFGIYMVTFNFWNLVLLGLGEVGGVGFMNLWEVVGLVGGSVKGAVLFW